MSRGGRIVTGLITIFLIILIAVLFLSFRLIRKSLPKTSGTVELQGLRSKVKIYRDDYGIPHIFANNEDDLFYAMGFVVAQDRLWQMDIFRRTAKGTLSEIFGTKTTDTDKLFRTIGLYRTAQRIAKQLSSESKNVLARYAAGVNSFITSNYNKLPLEFTLLNYKPQLWKIEDSIAYQRLIAWSLSLGWHYDLIFGALAEKLGYKKVREIFPEYLTSYPIIISSSSRKYLQLYEKLSQATTHIIGFLPCYYGSNSWVISGEKSKTGKPLLANDPHLKLSLPSMWYEVHLNAPFIDVYGVSIPGLPGIVIGHNRAIAWGLTNLMVDDMDFFIEKVNADKYLFKNKWYDLDTCTEIVPIRGQPPETLKVRYTNHGPIISDVHEALKNLDLVVSLKWVGHEMSDEILAYYKIIKATNWSQFTNGLRHFKVPGQNIIYADTSGNIGYVGASAIPIRKAGRGERPRPGWNGNYEWQGYVPFNDLPHMFNPSQHFIVTANNKIIDGKYPYYVSNYWEPPYRARRIAELLSNKDKYSIEDFKQIQFDRFSKHAEFIIPYINKVIKEIQIKEDLQKFFYDAINTWNFNQQPDEVAASIFQTILYQLISNTFKDEMGDTLYNQFVHLPSLPIRALDKILNKGYSKWFDDVNTPQKEDMKDIILKSVNDAYSYLLQHYGKIIDNWRWGKLHKIIFEHPLSKHKPLNVIFDIGPFPLGGANCTINVTQFPFTNPFTPVIGASTRQIVDLSNIDNSLSVIPTGQSGQPLDKHYKDQTKLWLEGNYHEAIMSIKKIEKGNFHLLVLKPK